MAAALYLRRLRIRGEQPAGWPDSTRVALCEGIVKPGKANAHWRFVAWLKREVLAPFAATKRCEQALREAAADLEHWGELLRGTNQVKEAERYATRKAEAAKARAAVKAAREALVAAMAAEQAWIGTLVDPRLGAAFVPGDCPDVEFVP